MFDGAGRICPHWPLCHRRSSCRLTGGIRSCCHNSVRRRSESSRFCQRAQSGKQATTEIIRKDSAVNQLEVNHPKEEAVIDLESAPDDEVIILEDDDEKPAVPKKPQPQRQPQSSQPPTPKVKAPPPIKSVPINSTGPTDRFRCVTVVENHSTPKELAQVADH